MPWFPTVINSEILSVHAALVPAGPSGRVLMFGGDEHWSAQGGTDSAPADPARVDRTALYHIDTRTVTRTTSPTTDVFCAGHAFLGDGRLLVVGGTEAWGSGGGPGGGHEHQHGNFGGHQACWIYNHHQNAWRRAADLNFSPAITGGGGRWYPSVVTVPSGDVAAFGGHPSRRSNNWHENDRPELYSAKGNFWSWYPHAMSYDPTGSLPATWYPRVSLIRGGWLFFTTRHNNQCRFFDPANGELAGPTIAAPPAPYNSGWDYSVIQLPLVPADDYRSRILAVNGVQPVKIDLQLGGGAATPAWHDAGARQGSAAGKARNYACPVYLPTGQIMVTGGINGGDDDDAVKVPEIYTPDINWDTRAYGSGAGTWATVEEPAQIARNYHTVALLLPDGSVFTASSSKDGNPGDPATAAQRNIEIFFPPSYFDNPGRPELTGAPVSLNYWDTQFTATLGSVAQAASIRRMALVRCGSVTHAGDFDQRYVVLAFTHQAGTANVVAEFPNDPSVVPPGNYMLWVVDQNGLPCRLARFVRVAHQGCTVITDRSTFSKEEVQATGAGGAAVFNNAVYLQFDGFIHTELTGTPEVNVTWADTGNPVPAGDFTLARAPRLQEVTPGFTDTPQRITFPFHVVFGNLNAYNGFTDRRRIRVEFTLGSLRCSQTLELTHSPNPYMIDIDPVANNEAWLSTDVRVFSLRTGDSRFGVFQGMGEPIQFIRQCLDRLNDPGADGDALFNSLSTSAKLDLASHSTFPPFPVFNYAIARVRYRAVTTTAQRVKCFFRMFNVQATGLEFNPDTTYRRTAVGPNTVPLLGTAGGAIASIPFFASPRVETVQGRPGAASMAAQALDPAYEIRDLPPEPGETTVYFGCWLDINQRRKLFPLNPGTSDGPWPDAACLPIQDLARGRHMCVVAELFFEPDPTNPGATPGTSDNLSQRNLAILHSDNPGGPDSHTVMHTFEIKPSSEPKLVMRATGSTSDRFRPDELLIRWHNLPAASKVAVSFSDIDTADVRRLATLRHSPLACDTPDKHTITAPVAGLTWIPIPGDRKLHIPALLSIQLPDTVTYGEEYRVTVHQVSGRTGRIIGSCEFRIPVSKAELILDEEIRDLSVFKHIVSTIPPDDRWYPLMKRYVGHLGRKVDALGGNAAEVHPNPDGSGKPHRPGPEGDRFTGTVHEVIYDCDGRFSGFVLRSCQHEQVYTHCGKAMEKLIRRACRDGLPVTVWAKDGRIRRVTLACCP